MSRKPVLVIGYGNESRGDDALGPGFLHKLDVARQSGKLADCFDSLTDYQLQIELVTDIVNYEMVIFVDASATASAPFEFTRVEPMRDESYTTHALSPGALLSVYCQFHNKTPPSSYLLALHGEQFDLGAPVSAEAALSSDRALDFIVDFLNREIIHLKQA